MTVPAKAHAVAKAKGKTRERFMPRSYTNDWMASPRPRRVGETLRNRVAWCNIWLVLQSVGVNRRPPTIETRRGYPLPVELGDLYDDASQAYLVVQARVSEQRFAGRGLQLRREATPSYNCHGLTFLMRRGLLFDENAILQCLKDDGYSEIMDVKQVLPGDLVLYFDNDESISHSGVVCRVEVHHNVITTPWVFSKWGELREYVHQYLDCPYSNPKFYREDPE